MSSGEEIKGWVDQRQVRIQLGAGSNQPRLSSIVAAAFLEKPTDANACLEHIDGNFMNNSAANFRWVS